MSIKHAAYTETASSLVQQGYGRFLNTEKTTLTLPKSLTPSKIGLRIVSSSKEQASKTTQKVDKYAQEHSTVFRLGVNNTLIFESSQNTSKFHSDITYACGHLQSLNFDKVRKTAKLPKEERVQPKSDAKPVAKVIVLDKGVTTEMFLKANGIRPLRGNNSSVKETPESSSSSSSSSSSLSSSSSSSSTQPPVDEPVPVESEENCISKMFSGAGRLLSSIWSCFIGAMRALGNFICCKKSENNSELTNTKPVTNENIISHKQVKTLRGG